MKNLNGVSYLNYDHKVHKLKCFVNMNQCQQMRICRITSRDINGTVEGGTYFGDDKNFQEFLETHKKDAILKLTSSAPILYQSISLY